MSKRAFLVAGPESSGTRLLTSILIAGGCSGSADHEQPWDKKWPVNEKLIVWRHSVPHGVQFPDLAGIVKVLRGKGYMVQALATVRDPWATAKSATAAGHTNNVLESYAEQEKAIRHIYQQFGIVNCPVMCVPYEALVTRPTAVQATMRKFYLLPKTPKVEVYDGNVKHYED